MTQIFNEITELTEHSEKRRNNLLKLTQFLAKNVEYLDYISFDVLQRQLSDTTNDETLDLGITLATTFDILDICYEYYDPNNIAHPISVEDVRESIRDNSFFDPISGNEVQDFKKNIVMYFVISESFKKIALSDAF